MEQPNSTSLRKEKGGRKYRFLLLLLLLLLLITTCVVSYMLGRRAVTGPIDKTVDTIILPSETPTVRTMAHLTGQVIYGDGSFAAEHQMELHSDPITTVTDANGHFLFPNVPFGEHHLTISYPNGLVAAEQAVYITQSMSNQGVDISETNDGYTITVAVNIRVLEIVIQLEEDGHGIRLGEYTYADEVGRVVTPSGISSVNNGTVVSPLGNVYLPDGTIVIPDRTENTAAVILSDDTVTYLEQELKGDGYVIKSDGTVAFLDGTEIKPGGLIVTPNGTEYELNKGGYVVDNGTVTPVGGDAPPIDDDGTFFMYGQDRDGEYVQWTQNCTIDLFYNRDSGTREKIAPGSNGYYLFRLDNSRSEALNIYITLAEESVHLPLSLTLTPLNADNKPETSQAVTDTLSDGSRLVMNTRIDAVSSTTYRLDWVWLAEGNNALDTQIGIGENLMYLLDMTIYAEST